VAYTGRGELVDLSGQCFATSIWTLPPNEHPRVFWMEPAQYFLLVGRRAAHTKTRLAIFASSDAREIASFEIDPSDLIPYDQHLFESIDRDRYTLLMDSSTRSVGSLLDVWHSVNFDSKCGVMQLATYRPIGMPFRENGELVCRVEERWFAIRVAV
jgi:hypothetical protein